MSASPDSRAYFRERALAVGLTPGDLDLFVADGRNWDPMGRFAFASSYMPASGDDRLFIEEVVTPVWGAHSPKKNLARRLHFEAYTFVASEMRSRVERTDYAPPKKMARVERDSRIDDIKARNGSLRIADHTEPGPTLVDTFSQMGDDGVLKYQPWAKTTSAKWESTMAKLAKDWAPNAAGQVKERWHTTIPDQHISKDVRALDQLFLRRGVAMEAAELLPLEVHEEVRTKFMDALDDEPADAERYECTSIAQIAKADAELFRRVAKSARGGIKKARRWIVSADASLPSGDGAPCDRGDFGASTTCARREGI